MDTFGAGVEVGTIFNKLNGPGPYVYMGPTFSFTLPGISETVTHGDTYIGLLFSGHGVKHGISGDLKGVETKETYTGVAIQVGPLAGVALVDNTVDYKLSCYDMIPASMDSTSISYDALTAMCLGAGLSGNPYPAPTTPVLYPPDANNIGHLIGESDYYTFTVKIGCKVYEGISCNVVDYALNFNTMELDGVSKATWYIGKLGCLHSGFKGIVYEYIYNYDPIANSWDYLTVSFMMTHGFGHFCGQRLWMYWDSRGSATTYGYCFVREH
jgi:hypothetical protein